MSLEAVSRAHYERQREVTKKALAIAAAQWQRLDAADLDDSWPQVGPRLLVAVTAAQAAAASDADAYTDGALAEQGVDDAQAAGRTGVQALAGVASDGRPLDSLLYEPVIVVKARVGQGAPTEQAMQSGLGSLANIVLTQVQDAGRVAVGVALASRRAASGYVRMLTPPSCSRCVILAGRFYRWNTGFDRHPRCDCRHIPAAEALPDLTTRPQRYFDSLSEAEQDKAFTKAGARAIRDGVSPIAVVNARRGAYGLSTAGARLTKAEAQAIRNGRSVGRLQTQRLFGRDLFTTTEGTTKRGLAGKRLGKAPRLMPESIYQIAGSDRDEAIRLLKRFGYII